MVKGTGVGEIMNQTRHEKAECQGYRCWEIFSRGSKGTIFEDFVNDPVPSSSPKIGRRCTQKQWIAKGFLCGPALDIFTERQELKGQTQMEKVMNWKYGRQDTVLASKYYTA